MTVPEPRALPGPISAIRLTYACEQGWWDTGEDEPEIWHVAADLYDWEGARSVEHVGDFEFYRADPYATRDLFGVLDGYDGDVGVIAESTRLYRLVDGECGLHRVPGTPARSWCPQASSTGARQARLPCSAPIR